jgi:hypothetical protein|tara:strand:+ start:441 stop:830 length:390 start_codon:yes stop_codon:yes gene_type:complete
MILMEINMKEIERFRTKFNNSSNTGCWTWIASKTQQGYGMFSYLGKSIPAHRFAYIHYKGEIPNKHIVHQTCQNNGCVNPEHLITCTKSESRLKYNSTRIHPDAKKLIQNIKLGSTEDHMDDFGFSNDA